MTIDISKIKSPIKARLKTGGPAMMVYPRTGAEGMSVVYGVRMKCTWFNGSKLEEVHIPHDMLDVVEESDVIKETDGNEVVKYKIEDIDYAENDAYLLISDCRLYFQWDGKDVPTIKDAIQFIKSEAK